MSIDTLTALPRPEHPRPDFMRDTFCNLNGTWQFAFDDGDLGLKEKWYRPEKRFDKRIVVPFAYQTRLSGLGPDDSIHPILWYRRSFTVPEEMRGKRVLLHFGAVDYSCAVFVNGEHAGGHKGGYTPFTLDITSLLIDGANDLCLRVVDQPDCTQPRGKQYWVEGLMGCWYTPVSGIWQTVWLDAVGEKDIKTIHITPDIDHHMFTAEIALRQMVTEPIDVSLTVSFEGHVVRRVVTNTPGRTARVPVDLIAQGLFNEVRHWSPERPDLYDLDVAILKDGVTLDKVHTYFGMRKVEVRKGKVYLNNRPIYQRLILDQGYWPDSLLTPPSDEALKLDVEMTKKLGYNGARKHQKIEDPRYYYWADRLGLLVWGEVPSTYDFTDETVRNLSLTLAGHIDRDFNHPSIISWTPLNESWGVRDIFANKRQQDAAVMLYHQTKAMDGTRLCSANDGWEQVETDICGLHDYADRKDIMAKHFASREETTKHTCDVVAAQVDAAPLTGDEAFLVTEYGGIAFTNIGLQGEMGGMETWGYHDKVTDQEAFFARFQAVTDAIRAIPYCEGYCYTQLTDVMQEVNGLLTPDRKPKMDVERFASMNGNPEGRA